MPRTWNYNALSALPFALYPLRSALCPLRYALCALPNIAFLVFLTSWAQSPKANPTIHYLLPFFNLMIAKKNRDGSKDMEPWDRGLLCPF